MITESDVKKAQDEWGKAIVEIGRAYSSCGDVVECAKKHINELYAYPDNVLFKPTKCKDRQFRPTFDGALSYFVGNALAPAGFAEDKGFAIAPFVHVHIENEGGILPGKERAIAMGNYVFTGADGSAVKVEYTFGYRRKGGKLVIDLHHSSIPYSG